MHPDTFGLRGVLELVADKWAILIIYHLHDKTLRHTQLKVLLSGVSTRMLTLTLRRLEQNGLVRRKVYPVTPPRVEYSLTPLGSTLVEPLKLLCAWSENHVEDVRVARIAYEVRAQAEAAALGEPQNG
ncbi:MAG: helix-turn-helix transcriptional regulator [Pleurocapsa minor GSE-CHR-MK-17-07R]|jgi:DNA-binding HxlR family transcriptional regulator|nr:helix-turn-helix transcriptional regulator [Pleurocapsa minor GSE-CHR-MK 17-07R]